MPSQHGQATMGNPTSAAGLENTDLEPNDEWKANLRKRIEGEFVFMVKDAKNQLEAAVRLNPEQRDQLIDDHLTTMGNIRRLAMEQFREELGRECQERRRKAGMSLDDNWMKSLREEQEIIYQQIKQSKQGPVPEGVADDVHGRAQEQLPELRRPPQTVPYISVIPPLPPEVPPPPPRSSASASSSSSHWWASKSSSRQYSHEPQPSALSPSASLSRNLSSLPPTPAGASSDDYSTLNTPTPRQGPSMSNRSTPSPSRPPSPFMPFRGDSDSDSDEPGSGSLSPSPYHVRPRRPVTPVQPISRSRGGGGHRQPNWESVETEREERERERLERERERERLEQERERLDREREEFEREREQNRLSQERERERDQEREREREREQEQLRERERLGMERERQRQLEKDREEREAREREERKNRETEKTLQELKDAREKAEAALRLAHEAARSKQIAEEQAQELKHRMENADKLAREMSEKHREAERQRKEALELQRQASLKEESVRKKELDIMQREKDLTEKESRLQKLMKGTEYQEEQMKHGEQTKVKKEETERLEDREMGAVPAPELAKKWKTSLKLQIDQEIGILIQLNKQWHEENVSNIKEDDRPHLQTELEDITRSLDVLRNISSEMFSGEVAEIVILVERGSTGGRETFTTDATEGDREELRASGMSQAQMPGPKEEPQVLDPGRRDEASPEIDPAQTAEEPADEDKINEAAVAVQLEKLKNVNTPRQKSRRPGSAVSSFAGARQFVIHHATFINSESAHISTPTPVTNAQTPAVHLDSAAANPEQLHSLILEVLRNSGLL